MVFALNVITCVVAKLVRWASMAKLYWRIKRNGKWTWEPVHEDNTVFLGPFLESIYHVKDVPNELESYDDEIVDKPEVYTDDEQG